MIFSVSSVIVLLFFSLKIKLYLGTIPLLISLLKAVLFLITQCSSPKEWLLTSKLLPCEQRQHLRCASWLAKSSLCRRPFNFLSCRRKICHNYYQLLIVRCVVKRREFRGNKKNCDNSDLLHKTLARLAQCSKPVKNRKKPIFLIYSSRFLYGF